MLLTNKIFLFKKFKGLFEMLLLDSSWTITEAYQIRKLYQDLQPHAKLFEGSRNSIFEKYVTLEDSEWSFDKKVLEALNQDMTELCKIEFNLSYEKLSITQNFTFKIAPSDLDFLEIFFNLDLG